MKTYNYLEAVTADAKQAILENLNYWKFADREDLEEIANDNLWADDNVTGNGCQRFPQSKGNATHDMAGNGATKRKADLAEIEIPLLIN